MTPSGLTQLTSFTASRLFSCFGSERTMFSSTRLPTIISVRLAIDADAVSTEPI